MDISDGNCKVPEKLRFQVTQNVIRATIAGLTLAYLLWMRRPIDARVSENQHGVHKRRRGSRIQPTILRLLGMALGPEPLQA